jgi:hypothetical protein
MLDRIGKAVPSVLRALRLRLVFTRRAVDQETIPIRSGDEASQLGLRKRNDGQVHTEFHHDESMDLRKSS